MPGLTRREVAGVTLGGAAFLAPVGVRAQTPPPMPPVGPRPPDALPAVLAPGSRLVWFQSSATIPGASSQLVPDPHGRGWTDPHGHHFTESDVPGPAGAGFLVADVLSAGPTGFLLNVALLLLQPGNAVSFIDSNGLTADATKIGDYWISPKALASVVDQDSPALRILHLPRVIDGHTYQALCIQSRGAGGWNQLTFDLDTGLGLIQTSAGSSGPVLIPGPGGQAVQGPGSALLTFSQYKGSRATRLPGPGAVYPEAVRRLRSITYAATKSVSMPPPVLPLPPSEFQIRYEIVANAGPYLTARKSTPNVAGATGAVDRLVPAGVCGSVWMDPAYLKELATGQVIDQDPLTGVAVVCSDRSDSRVSLVAKTALVESLSDYDLDSGLLARGHLRETVQSLPPATLLTTFKLESKT